jgi:hypothetical protein
MRLAYLAFIAFVGGLTFLVLFIADRERQAGRERPSEYQFTPHSASALDADPDLRLVSTHSPYMRTER